MKRKTLACNRKNGKPKKRKIEKTENRKKGKIRLFSKNIAKKCRLIYNKCNIFN